MATVDLIPNGEGTVQQWDPLHLPHWGEVDDPVGTPDEDTTYVHTGVDTEIEEFNHKTSGLLIGATITNVRVTARMKMELGPAPATLVNIGVKVGVTRYGAVADTALTTSYADYFKDWANNPAPPGDPWTKPDIDNLQSSLKAIVPGVVAVHCTQIYLTVTYTLANPLIGKPLISPDIIKKAIIR